MPQAWLLSLLSPASNSTQFVARGIVPGNMQIGVTAICGIFAPLTGTC
jgi:hypothetical protein